MVHCFSKLNGFYVYDVESGSLLLANKLFYLMCKKMYGELSREEKASLEQFTPDQIEKVKHDIQQLEKQEVLNAKQPEVKPVKKQRGLKALCINITHDCNLACVYCFASESKTDEENCKAKNAENSSTNHSKAIDEHTKPKGLYGTNADYFDLETGKKAIDFLIENSGTRHNLEVDFFGGEPLLNFDILKKIVEYARTIESTHNKKFNFTITTNCVALTDEHIEFINSEIFNVVLSIDGRKNVHDYTRNDSYSVAVENAKKLVASRGKKSYYVRGTFTSNNIDFVNDVLHLYDCGFSNISVEPVVLPPSHSLCLHPEHLDEIGKQYEELAKQMLKPEYSNLNFFHFNVNLEGGPCIDKRINACGAGVEYLAVIPSGDLYPCHQFAGKTDYLLGNVFSGLYKSKTQISDKFLHTTVLNKKDCADCFAKYHCSGGCFANSVNINNNFDDVYKMGCEMFKQRLEVSLALLQAKSNSDKFSS